MTYKSPSGVFNYTQVPDDAGDADIHVYVNDEEVSAGGGGSSDFTTAHMTVNISGDGLKYCPIPLVTENAIEIIYPNENTQIANGEYDVPLYKGKLIVETGCSSITVTGDASFDDEGLLIITGDCEITAFTPN